MASIRKRPSRPKPWEAVYRDPAGRQRTRSFARKADAQRFLAGVEADMVRGGYVDPSAGKVLFREYAEGWLASRTSDPSTVRGLRSRLDAHLLPVFGDKPLMALKPSGVQAWLAGLQRDGYAPSTILLLLKTLAQILAAAIEDRLLAPPNPCRSRSVRPPRLEESRRDAWVAERVTAVTGALPSRCAALVGVGVGLGVRQGEAFGLTADAVDFLRHEVRVVMQVKLLGGKPVFAPPKGGRARTVPLPESVAFALAEHMRLHPPVEVTLPWVTLDGEPRTLPLVFTTRRGGYLHRRAFVRDTWKPALLAAGVEATRDNGYHVLRHTYTSNLLQAGVSVSAVAKYLGHADGGGLLLRTYGHVMPQAPDQARAAVDTFLRSCEPGVSQEAER